jgi:hypothetical protein
MENLKILGLTWRQCHKRPANFVSGIQIIPIRQRSPDPPTVGRILADWAMEN